MATRLRNLRLSELSLVDSPANKGAHVSIFKRDFTAAERKALADSGAAMENGSFPIKSATDLTNAVHDWGRAGSKPDVKAHIIARAKALGATDALPDGWVSKSAGDPDMSIKKALGLPETATDAEVTAAVTKNATDTATALAAKTASDAALAKLNERLEKADMSDKHTAFMNNDKAKMPKGGKAAFQAMEPAERDAHCAANPINGGDDDTEKRFNAAVAAGVAKALAGEEVIKVGDVEIRKSVVGDAHFAVFKAQQAEIVKANDAREIVELQKRADTEFGQLPGESIAKAKVLKVVARMPETERADLERMLKGGNAALKTLMNSVGGDGGVAGGAIEQMNAKAETYRTGQAAVGKSLSKEQAFAKVWEDPANVDLKKAYAQEEAVAKRSAAA